MILTCGSDVSSKDSSEARIWDAASFQPIGELRQPRGIIRWADFSPDGKIIRTLSTGGGRAGILVDLWDSTTGRRLGQPAQGQFRAFRPDGKAILFALPGNRLQLWDPIGGQPLGQPIDTKGHDYVLASRPDGQIILIRDNTPPGWTAWIWDLSWPGPIGEPLRHQHAVAAAAFSADGKLLATWGGDQTAQIWDAATGRPIGPRLTVDAPSRLLGSPISFSPDGRVLLTMQNGGTVRRWDVGTGRRIYASDPSVLQTEVPELSGDKLLKKYGNASVRLEEVRRREGPWTIGPPLVHSGGISAYALNVDGTMALLGGPDGSVRVWDPVTGKPIGPPLAHSVPISALAFYPKEEAIVVRCQDKTIHLWKLSTPVSAEVARVVLWVQVISGMELDPTRGQRLLDASSHERLRERLEAQGGPP